MSEKTDFFAHSNTVVLLLHGLGRTSTSMSLMARRLEKENYRVINWHYNSTGSYIDSITGELHELIQPFQSAHTQISFVTHSLGGIIVRYYIQQYQPDNVGKIVMLSPPNSGSVIADMLHNSEIARFILGPNLKILRHNSDFLKSLTKLEDFDVGVITGTKGQFFSLFMEETNDGKVSITSAYMKGIKDFQTIHRTHTWIMYSNEVIRKVIEFLNTGSFSSNC